jgi:hypothetical protein
LTTCNPENWRWRQFFPSLGIKGEEGLKAPVVLQVANYRCLLPFPQVWRTFRLFAPCPRFNGLPTVSDTCDLAKEFAVATNLVRHFEDRIGSDDDESFAVDLRDDGVVIAGGLTVERLGNPKDFARFDVKATDPQIFRCNENATIRCRSCLADGNFKIPLPANFPIAQANCHEFASPRTNENSAFVNGGRRSKSTMTHKHEPPQLPRFGIQCIKATVRACSNN